MPPEQFTGATIDGRADLFSLGVILYWLATGDKPFAGDTITAVSYKIVHSSPAPPRRINPAVPAALEMIILKCLEKDPAARYLTGEALAADLAAGRAGRMPASQGATTSQATANTAMAPVSIMDGDPNTTLDSDARMQMAPKSQSPAGPQPIPTSKPGLMQNPRGLIGIAAAVLILIIGIFAWRVVKHRRDVRAEAEAAAQIQLQVEQQKQAELDALAKLQKAQQEAAGASAPAAADQSAGAAPAGQPGTQFNANAIPAAGSSGNSNSPQTVGGATRGSTADKKPATKTPPGRGPAKSPAQSGPAPTSTASNPPQANPTQTASPTTQTQANQAQPSAPPAPTPPKTNSSDTAAQPQPAPGGGAPATAPTEVAKLHIDDGRVPLGASFIVMMDGKVFFQRKALGEHESDPTRDDLSVPPGDHEFRVITSQGGIHVGDSNTVRANFQPKKKLLLHIDVRDNSSGQMMKKASKLEADKSDFLISVKAPNLLGF